MEAVALARRHDEKVMVEEFVPGMEIEVGVLGNLPSPEASLPGQVVAHNADWYDYSSKYDEGGSELVVPPPGLTEAQIERAREVAIAAFVATSCEGMARADFFVRETDGEIVMNELNTIPGFTATSFYARLFAASGIEYRSCSTGSSSSRSSATSAGRVTRILDDRSAWRCPTSVRHLLRLCVSRARRRGRLPRRASASSRTASSIVSGQRTRMQFP